CRHFESAGGRLYDRGHGSSLCSANRHGESAVPGSSCGPNITRNDIVNCSELVTYDIIKELILKYNIVTDNLPCHFTAAFSSGFITTIVASPVDVVKTRFLNCSAGKYNSTINCAVTMMRNEGPKAFYKGFMPSFLHVGSWNIVMFVIYEKIKMHVMRSQQSWESLYLTCIIVTDCCVDFSY
uniref:Uncharacterized protein n=1 Tax=Oncorhynchus tshawytscha TaxID=74940 RepID=A0AAZ3SEE3_ONCTS